MWWFINLINLQEASNWPAEVPNTVALKELQNTEQKSLTALQIFLLIVIESSPVKT